MEKVNGTTLPGLNDQRKDILCDGLTKRKIDFEFKKDDVIKIENRCYQIKKSWLSALTQQEYEDQLTEKEKRNALIAKAKKLGFKEPADIKTVSNRSLQSFIRYRTKLVLEVELAPMSGDVVLPKHEYLSEIVLKASLFKMFKTVQ